MEFNYLYSNLNKIIESPLLGIEAHKILAPLDRQLFTKYNIPTTAKKAGVMVLLYPNKQKKATILLTKRAKYKGVHSHQISFPGGKKSLEDVNLKATAIRETFEEVGLPVNHPIIHKQLSYIYIPPSNFKVNSYLATIDYTPTFITNYEVDSIIEITIDELLNNKNLTTFNTLISSSKQQDVPCFMFKEHYVWGATAMILNELKEVLKKL